MADNFSQPLQNVLPERCPRYCDTRPYVPTIQEECYVVKVYDGDTFTIATHVGMDKDTLYRFSVRLRGVNCCEIRTRDPEEKIRGKLARDFVRSKIMSQKVKLLNVDFDKYGRLLADTIICSTNEDLATILIENGHAKKYMC